MVKVTITYRFRIVSLTYPRIRWIWRNFRSKPAPWNLNFQAFRFSDFWLSKFRANRISAIHVRNIELIATSLKMIYLFRVMIAKVKMHKLSCMGFVLLSILLFFGSRSKELYEICRTVGKMSVHFDMFFIMAVSMRSYFGHSKNHNWPSGLSLARLFSSSNGSRGIFFGKSLW